MGATVAGPARAGHRPMRIITFGNAMDVVNHNVSRNSEYIITFRQHETRSLKSRKTVDVKKAVSSRYMCSFVQ